MKVPYDDQRKSSIGDGKRKPNSKSPLPEIESLSCRPLSRNDLTGLTCLLCGGNAVSVGVVPNTNEAG